MKAPEAGNTVETLKPVDVNEAATKSAVPVTDTPVPSDEQKEAEISAAVATAVEADPDLKAQVEADAASLEVGVKVELEKVRDELEGSVEGPVSEFEKLKTYFETKFEAIEDRFRNFNSRSGHQI